MMPRRPVDLYYDVSQPSEWTASTACGTWERSATISSSRRSAIRSRATCCAARTTHGCFHQANLRDLGGGKSLLSDVLDAVFAKYAARATFPVATPTMDELAERVEARMDFDASGVTATIGPGPTLSVHVVNAATVPVTGLCTPGAESYAGQQISYLTLAAGQSMTVSLADCNPARRARGGGGTGGAGGSATIGTLGNADGGAGLGNAPDVNGCACGVSGYEAGRGAWAALIALAVAAGLRRRLRR
jgi:MYXO-CTERM domain-containing protein